MGSYVYYRASRTSFWETARGSLDRGVQDQVWVQRPETDPHLGANWSFPIDGYRFNDSTGAVRVCIFGDTFKAFTELPALFTSLAAAAKDGPLTLDDVEDILLSHGIPEETP